MKKKMMEWVDKLPGSVKRYVPLSSRFDREGVVADV
jgi:hypothetical protein